MILGGHCFLYVGAAWPAPQCRLFVHKVRAGELGPDNSPAELRPTHTIEWWDEAEVWGRGFGGCGGGGRIDGGGRGSWMRPLSIWCFPEWVSWDLGGGRWEPEHIPIGLT